jgi:acetyl esterase/lipase
MFMALGLIGGLLLALVGLLTVRPAPTYTTWKLAILAGEFGHVLAILALPLALVALVKLAGAHDAMGRSVGGVGLLLALVAGAWLLRPAFTAHHLARDLPRDLAASLGGEAPAGPVLSLGRAWRGPSSGAGDGAATVETHVFASGDGGEDLVLDFYRPAHPRPSASCIVVVHGGGWDSGDRLQLATWNRLWAARGHPVAAVSYRLAPEFPWPAQREDVLTALAWLKAHAENLGLAADNFVLLGRSAGGQIATTVAYTADDPAIRAVASFYSPYDMRFVWSIARADDVLNSVKLLTQYLAGPPEEGRQALYDSASPERLVRGPAHTPPTLLVHGALDQLVWHRHSERLDARLAAAGVPRYFLSLPWATHACDFNPHGPSGQLIDYAVSWLLRQAEAPRHGPTTLKEPTGRQPPSDRTTKA